MTTATVKIPANLNVCGGEIQNAKFQSLISKSNATEAEFWYDSVNHKPMYNNGTIDKEFGKEYADFTGTDGVNAGISGLVPAPTISDEDCFLKGDGTWGTPAGTIYTFSTGLSTSGSTVSVDTTIIAQKSDIPTKTSDLTNDSGFLTSHQDISGKANKANTLAGYGITDAYTKTEIDGKLTSSMHYKGTVANQEALNNISSPSVGDVYNVTSTGDNYAYDGTNWDKLSGVIDLSTYDTHLADSVIHVTSSDKTTWNGKQDAISDLATIRSGAAAGATALQSINSSDVISALGYTPCKKITVTNSALTASNGVCTWTITNTIGSADIDVSVYEVGSTSNTKIYPAIDVNANNIVVTMLSSSNISSGGLKAVITG